MFIVILYFNTGRFSSTLMEIRKLCPVRVLPIHKVNIEMHNTECYFWVAIVINYTANNSEKSEKTEHNYKTK